MGASVPESELCKEMFVRLADALEDALGDDAGYDEIMNLLMQTVAFERAAGIEVGARMCRAVVEDPRFEGTSLVDIFGTMEAALKAHANYCRETAPAV